MNTPPTPKKRLSLGMIAAKLCHPAQNAKRTEGAFDTFYFSASTAACSHVSVRPSAHAASKEARFSTRRICPNRFS